MRRPVVAWAGLGIAAILLVVGGILTAAGSGDVGEVIAGFVLALPFAAVGAFVSARQPRNRIGWLLLGIGTTLSVSLMCDGAIQHEIAHPGSLARIGIVALVSSTAFSVFLLLLFLLLILVPTGRLPSRKWRFSIAGIALLGVVDVALLVRPGPFDDWEDEGIDNPLGIVALEPVTGVLYQLANALLVVLLLTSLASVVLRFRRSAGVERAQLRWIAAAVAATGITWATMIVGSLILDDSPVVDVLWVSAILSISFIPIGIGIAVMRYRLYEIDRVISRTLVYAAVTIFLGASYVGLVLAGQALFSSFAGGSNLAIAGSTLVVAALFLPVRSRVQRFVDQQFNRRRYDAQRTLEAFGARLREQIDLETLETSLEGVVTDTMQPTHTSVWLRTGATT